MKVVEKIFEHRIRQQIEIDDMQFGFVKGKATTDAIFMARQMQENFRVKDKKVSWAMRKLGVEESLVSAVMSMYTGAKTVVTRVYANSKSFEVKVGMHQGSALSPLLFAIVMEAISREFRVALPWEQLYADVLAVIAETEEELIKRHNEWKDNVESKGMSVNMNKTKVMISGERQMVRQKDHRFQCSASKVTTLWRYTNLFIIIIMLDGHAGSAVKVSVAIQYSVVVARNGYIRNVVV